MKRLYALRLAILVVGLLTGWACTRTKTSAPHNEEMDTTAQLVMRVSRCSRLYTSEMQIHKLVTHSDEVRLKGRLFSSDYNMRLPVGDRKAIVPIDVTLKAYIDFSGFDSTRIVRQGRHVTLILPDPVVMVTASKVDHQGTRQYVDPLRPRYSDAELTDLAKQGIDTIVSHIDRYGLMESARQSATRTLVPLFRHLGYDEKNVTIRFRNGLTADELSRNAILNDGRTHRLQQ